MSNRQKLKWNGKIYYKAKCKKLEEFDCSTRSSRFFTAAYYDSHDRLIDYNSTQVMGLDPEWDDIIPDSVGEKMLDEICNTYRTEKLNN